MFDRPKIGEKAILVNINFNNIITLFFKVFKEYKVNNCIFLS